MDQLEDSASSHDHGLLPSKRGNSDFENEPGILLSRGFYFDTLFVVIFLWCRKRIRGVQLLSLVDVRIGYIFHRRDVIYSNPGVLGTENWHRRTLS